MKLVVLFEWNILVYLWKSDEDINKNVLTIFSKRGDKIKVNIVHYEYDN